MQHKTHFRSFFSWILIFSFNVVQGQLPVVENVRFSQRTDGSLLVDIYYDVTTAGGLPLEVTVEASDDNGASWDLPCTSLTGDVGTYIEEGTNKHVTWDFFSDNPHISGSEFRVRVTSDCMVCGQVITDDYTLTSDLTCISDTVYMIKIGADSITFDLNGYLMKGPPGPELSVAIEVDAYDEVTIKNGIIDGFINGIAVVGSNHTIVENMIITNMGVLDPEVFVVGIQHGVSSGIIVRDIVFTFPPVAHKNGIHTGNGEISIDHIEMNGGGVGIDFSGVSALGPSYATVTNSTFNHVTIAGILIQKCESGLISNSIFDHCEIGIMPDITHSREDSLNVIIEENEIRNGFIGILNWGASNLTIRNNTVMNNGANGIDMEPDMSCANNIDYPDSLCMYSTDNKIQNNIVKGNYIDLYHDEKCLGNTWKNNDCETSLGSEIPPCTPMTTTAHTYFSRVDSAAKEQVADAQLIKILSSACDSIGTSYKWQYIYWSDTEQEYYEIWFKNGELIVKDSLTVPWEISEDLIPISEPWIGSDATMALANDQGGWEFIQTNNILSIEMKLVNLSGWFVWEVIYLGDEDMLFLRVDAPDN